MKQAWLMACTALVLVACSGEQRPALEAGDGAEVAEGSAAEKTLPEAQPFDASKLGYRVEFVRAADDHMKAQRTLYQGTSWELCRRPSLPYTKGMGKAWVFEFSPGRFEWQGQTGKFMAQYSFDIKGRYRIGYVIYDQGDKFPTSRWVIGGPNDGMAPNNMNADIKRRFGCTERFPLWR